MTAKRLPIGYEDYKEIIERNSYYVDKTMFIRELSDENAKVSLFLRPRRFGKTLMLSMLQYFYEDTGNEELNAENRALFEGMKIMDAPSKYREDMTSYPVISLTLKSAKQNTFEVAYKILRTTIAKEFRRHKTAYNKLADKANQDRWDRITDIKGDMGDFATSIQFLSECLYEAYGKRVIILIDEYDVPLESSYFSGFYNEMISFIRTIFESALKTNKALQFAVLTGCLRVSRESLFTGLNHLRIYSVLSEKFTNHYGFTQEEIDEILTYCNRWSRREDLRHWYNGYNIGDNRVYNPWSAVNSIVDIIANENTILRPYWINSGSSEIIKTLVENSKGHERKEIEALLNGGSVTKPIREDITYADLTQKGDNLWNFLLFTGYLTALSVNQEGSKITAELAIPNTEIKSAYEDRIHDWFKNAVRQKDLSGFYEAILSGDAQTAGSFIKNILYETISYYDYAESYYHGILIGLLCLMKTHYPRSNRESGKGRADIVLIPNDIYETVIIIEIKVCQKAADMDKDAEAALKQIEGKDYEAEYRNEEYEKFIHYGAAFYKKNVILKVHP